MKVSVRDYREGLGVGSETCWSEKLIGSKPWQALEFRLCMSYFQSASLPNWLSNWRKQRTHYFVLVFRLFAAFFSLTLSLTLPLFFSVSFPFCFISSLPALPSLPHHFSVCFSFGYSLLPHNPSVWAWLNWTVDISKVDKCPTKITRNHSAFHPHETTFFPLSHICFSSHTKTTVHNGLHLWGFIMCILEKVLTQLLSCVTVIILLITLDRWKRSPVWIRSLAHQCNKVGNNMAYIILINPYKTSHLKHILSRWNVQVLWRVSK